MVRVKLAVFGLAAATLLLGNADICVAAPALGHQVLPRQGSVSNSTTANLSSSSAASSPSAAAVSPNAKGPAPGPPSAPPGPAGPPSPPTPPGPSPPTGTPSPPTPPKPPGQPAGNSSVPYTTPDISHFNPNGGAKTDSDYSSQLCTWLGPNFAALSSLTIVDSFGQYYPEGSNPSLELLSTTYPHGVIPSGTDLRTILETVGPDIDMTQDAGYGWQDRVASRGPLGTLPAFCRYGGHVVTSQYNTKVLFEVWMPLAGKPGPGNMLTPVNATDYPTDSTPIELDANLNYVKGPAYLFGGSDISASNDTARRSVARKQQRRQSSDTAMSGDQVLGGEIGSRLLVIGNGGQRGFVPLTDLKQAMSRYRFAVAGSNAGHFSSASSAVWINGTQRLDTLLDWTARATHVTRQAAEEVVNVYYGNTAGVRVPNNQRRDVSNSTASTAPPASNSTAKLPGPPAGGPPGPPGPSGPSGPPNPPSPPLNPVNSPNATSRLRTYFAGCSVGGKMGMGSVQMYPDDFDGVLVGAPAIFFNRLNRGQIHTQVVHRKSYAGAGYFNVTLLPGLINAEILRQCDALDGVADGVLSDPRQCNPNLQTMLCPAGTKGTQTTCLTQPQIDNLATLYQPTVLNDTFVYDQYFPGAEKLVSSLTGTASKGISYTQLAILEKPALDPTFDGYTQFTLDVVQQGEASNPSGSNTDNRDISPFLNAGKKLIHYHGLADITVSPAASMRYYDEVTTAVQGKLNDATLRDNYKLYPIPGMGHCRDGPGPWHFGGVTQNDAGNRPYQFDTQHDVLLSLIAWTEQGLEPEYAVGAHYNGRSKIVPPNPDDGPAIGATDLAYLTTEYQSYNNGLVHTRKLCPYPQFAHYTGGPTDGETAYQSFDCVVPPVASPNSTTAA